MGYIEFTIPYEIAKDHLPGHTLHNWPRIDFFMYGFPNEDGSVTMNVYAPLTGRNSFEHLTSNEKVEAFMRLHFPDVCDIIPNVETLFERIKVSFLQDY